MIDLGPTYSH